ncbi:unnamed protein product [Meloidogyne enterolobii]|uniref:Uncharacterized protein n=1 Tax=Meloidogyne enterolobii TaxID=390850 RepID=A0ACB1AY89_MELEN
MLSLPFEVQLDILKCLDFNQLFDIKQTNLYFCNLINKYEGELARLKFKRITISDPGFPRVPSPYKSIKPKSTDFEFALNDQLKKKWQAAIDKSIPLLYNIEPDDGKSVSITTVDKKLDYFLNLPTFPKNIEEMIIVRCWLEQLFKCAFESADFYQNVFNPELINILFDNDKTLPLQFNTQKAILSAENKTFENVLKYALTHLSIAESLKIYLYLTYISFASAEISEQYTDILFNILINEGNRCPKICLEGFRFPRIYDLITEVSKRV